MNSIKIDAEVIGLEGSAVVISGWLGRPKTYAFQAMFAPDEKGYQRGMVSIELPEPIGDEQRNFIYSLKCGQKISVVVEVEP